MTKTKNIKNTVLKFLSVMLVTVFMMLIMSNPLEQTNRAIAAGSKDSNVQGYEDRISQLKKDQQEFDRLMKEAQKNAEDYLKQKEYIDKQLNNLQEQIDLSNELLEEYNNQIVEKEAEIKEKEAEIKEKEKHFHERMRVSYENGTMNYLSMLFKASSLSDFLISLERITNMLDYDKRTMKEINDKKAELQKQKTEINALKESQQKIADDLDVQKEELEKTANEAEVYYKAELNKKDEYLKKYQQAKAAEDKAAAELDAYLKELANKNNGTFTGEFAWPLTNSHNYITSKFGPRTYYIYGRWVSDVHRGIDISCTYNTPVKACAAGRVEIAQWNNSYGYYVVISHGSGYTTLYAHNTSLKVKVGQYVNKGDVIALSGSTGNSSGPHLHLEISKNGVLLDPLNCGMLSHPALTGYYK